jgi:hypothetical protein
MITLIKMCRIVPVCTCFGSGFTESGSGSSILGWIPIRIQSGSGVFMTKNWKKNLKFFGSKIAIYLFLGLHKGRSSYMRSLHSSTSKHENSELLNIYVGNFCPLDPDPGNTACNSTYPSTSATSKSVGHAENWKSYSCNCFWTKKSEHYHPHDSFTLNQGCGSAFISSGSGSSILG